MVDSIRIGIVTVSDRASRGEYEDLGGPAITKYLNETLSCDWIPVTRVISDDQVLIEQTLRELAETEHCCLIVTTGGTGPAPRDVTPDATEAVCEKMMPGFGELMRTVSLQRVPTAILSRQTAGIIGRTLIVNLPGKPSAIAECLDAVFPAIPYCIDLIEGPRLTTNENALSRFAPKARDLVVQWSVRRSRLSCSSEQYDATFIFASPVHCGSVNCHGTRSRTASSRCQ